MSKFKYAKDGRLLFTKDMREEYTILIPMMLPIHLTFMKNILQKHGYKAELLDTTHTQIVEEGLQNVHNDTCYPALLVIGQLLDAIDIDIVHRFWVFRHDVGSKTLPVDHSALRRIVHAQR